MNKDTLKKHHFWILLGLIPLRGAIDDPDLTGFVHLIPFSLSFVASESSSNSLSALRSSSACLRTRFSG